MVGAPETPSPSERELLRGVGNNVLLAYWDANLYCRYANDTYKRWFGVSPEKLIGSHVTDHMRPTYERNRLRIEAALRGEPQRFECDIPAGNGEPVRHCLANYIPHVREGTVRGFYVMTYDVSELKEAQLAHETSEAKFSRIIELAGDAIITIDEERKVRVFNACAEEIYGYRAEEVIGQDVVMLGPENFRDAYAAAVDRFMTSPDISNVLRATSGIGRRKNGDQFPIEVTQSRYQVNGVTQVTFLVRDVTDRVRAEREQRVLAETGAILGSSLDCKQMLAEVAKLCVAHLADTCVIDMASADGTTLERVTIAHSPSTDLRLLAQLAQLREDPRHRLSHEVFVKGEPAIFAEMDLGLFRSYGSSEEHARVIEEFGRRSALIIPLKLHGAVIGTLGFASTHPRAYSEDDLPLATELARRVATAIHNARLLEAEQRATRARDEILEVVAHDLRSPLNSILLGAQVLQYTEISDPVALREIESILRSTQWANRLIEDLLDVRRIEGGILAITPTKVSPREAITASLTMHNMLATAAGISIRQDIAADVSHVWADRDRLRQVLENLVGNALKFTSPGGRIAITVTNDSPKFVRFSVSDTGTGIPEENLERVFDKFWQANRTERRGAGLGLPICKGIVEKHGGRIWGTSSIGQGTTFHFTLPVAS